MIYDRRFSRISAFGLLAASAFAATAVLGGAGCSNKVHSSQKGLVLGFVPSTEADKIAEDAQPMADYLTKALGVPVTTFTSTQYSGLIEAMGSGKVDIGSLPPLGYVIAKDKGAADVLLKTVRKGHITYHSMFVARADSGIKSIEDAKGKRMAFVDPASTSGFLFPAEYLKKKNIDYKTFFSQYIFAGGHDSAVRAVYDKDVDVAAVYDDARDKLESQPAYKDVKQKVVKIGDAGEIPNDTISVRQKLDPALVAKIKAALLAYAASPDGKKTLEDVYEVDGLVDAKDADYDSVRDVARDMNVQLSTIDKPKGKPKASPAASGSPAAAVGAPSTSPSAK